MMKMIRLIALGLLFVPALARADYQHRLSVGAGVIIYGNPSLTQFEVGAEFEYRVSSLIGLGFFGNYLFSTPGIALIGAPQISVHPLLNPMLVSLSPLIEFGSGIGTNLGLRLGARLPLPLGAFSLVPTASVDFISGGPFYILGLGLEF